MAPKVISDGYAKRQNRFENINRLKIVIVFLSNTSGINMADLDEEKCDPETLLLRRHKKEKKDLQGSKKTQKNIIIYVSINVLTLFFLS